MCAQRWPLRDRVVEGASAKVKSEAQGPGKIWPQSESHRRADSQGAALLDAVRTDRDPAHSAAKALLSGEEGRDGKEEEEVKEELCAGGGEGKRSFPPKGPFPLPPPAHNFTIGPSGYSNKHTHKFTSKIITKRPYHSVCATTVFSNYCELNHEI
jgi:hypothetical protein